MVQIPLTDGLVRKRGSCASADEHEVGDTTGLQNMSCVAADPLVRISNTPKTRWFYLCSVLPELQSNM